MDSPAPSELSLRTGFAFNRIDRMAEHREDGDFLNTLMDAAATRFVLIGRDRPVLRPVEGGGLNPFFSGAEARAIGAFRETALLGQDEGGAIFAALLDDSAVVIQDVADEGNLIDTRRFIVPGRADLVVHDLRALATEGLAPVQTLGVLGEAKSLMHWHARHRFCSNCGAPSQLAAAGWRRECPSCRALHFPRTDPVVIMLAVDGDRCLLGRQPRFNKGMYSALAGFLEPGETIEDAVRREIREESGIECGAVKYAASQPWPFPASLMIGCIAKALTRNITIDRTELEDCRWFSRADVTQMLARNHPQGFLAPHPLAIAHHLVRAWHDGETPEV